LVDAVVVRVHGDEGVVADGLLQLEKDVVAALRSVGQIAVAAGVAVADHGARVAPLLHVTRIEFRAREPCVEAAV
jgi:hypothetical protein